MTFFYIFLVCPDYFEKSWDLSTFFLILTRSRFFFKKGVKYIHIIIEKVKHSNKFIAILKFAIAYHITEWSYVSTNSKQLIYNN